MSRVVVVVVVVVVIVVEEVVQQSRLYTRLNFKKLGIRNESED